MEIINSFQVVIQYNPNNYDIQIISDGPSDDLQPISEISFSIRFESVNLNDIDKLQDAVSRLIRLAFNSQNNFKISISTINFSSGSIIITATGLLLVLITGVSNYSNFRDGIDRISEDINSIYQIVLKKSNRAEKQIETSSKKQSQVTSKNTSEFPDKKIENNQGLVR